MQPNPALRKLGFADTDRLVILHVDDVGSCQAANAAMDDLIEFGLISSAAVMVPCPWYQDAVAFCRRHADKVDMGVHLTLNSEWENYRWGPLSTRDPASGLIDEQGYFHRRQPALHAAAAEDAVRLELQTQIERALASGIDVTHIDSHMFALGHSRLLPIYADVARQFRLPPTLILRGDETRFRRAGLEGEMLEVALRLAQEMEADGFPLVDHVEGFRLDTHERRIDEAKEMLAALPAGITHFYMHPTHDTPEIRAMAPDWRSRVADYHAMLSEELRDYIREKGIHIIGNRVLRDLIRQ